MMAVTGSRDSLSIETSSVKQDVPTGPALQYQDYEQLVLNSNKEGMDFLRRGQFKQAFEQLKYAEAVVASKQGQDEPTNLMSVTCNNLGCYYKKVGKLHAALGYLGKALKIEVSLRTDDVTVAGTHLNVCAILSKLDKHDKALQHALCALELIQTRVDALGDAASQDEFSVLAIAYHNVAVEHDYLRQLSEAAQAYQKGHAVAKKCLGEQHPLTQTLAKNADVALQKSQKAAAANAGAEADRKREGAGEAGRTRKASSSSQAGVLPEIRSKDPSIQEGEEEAVSRAQSMGAWQRQPSQGGASQRTPAPSLPPLVFATQQGPGSLTSSVRGPGSQQGEQSSPEERGNPSFLESLGPGVRANRPPSPPPLIMESEVPRPPERPAETGAGRPPRSPTAGGSKRPSRNRRSTAAAPSEHDAGLVPAAQQSMLIRKSAAVKIQNFWREHHRHKVQLRDQSKLSAAAATKIQARWRGFSVRRGKIVKAARIIQRHTRGFLVRVAIRRHKAAVVIQRYALGFLTRRNLRQAVDAAIRIQRIARVNMAKVEVEVRRRLIHRAARVIRGQIRSWVCRRDLSELRVHADREEAVENAALKIQSTFRGCRGRKTHRKLRMEHDHRLLIFRSAAKLQALCRRHMARTKVAKMRAARLHVSDEAATRIRKMWLGYIYRRRYLQLRQEFLNHVDSVVTLQRYARGYLVRLRMWRDAIQTEQRLWAAVEIQRCWRGYMGRLRWEMEYERLWSRETAALIIQRNVRGWLARSAVTGRRKRKARAEFEKARRRFKAAQKIQALTRGVQCRTRVKAFWRRKVEAATTIQRIWRGHRLRCKRYEQERHHQLVKIQSLSRTFLVRCRRFHLLARVILVQRHWRKWLRYIPEAERARRRGRSLQQRKAATIIQQSIRESQSQREGVASSELLEA